MRVNSWIVLLSVISVSLLGCEGPPSQPPAKASSVDKGPKKATIDISATKQFDGDYWNVTVNAEITLVGQEAIVDNKVTAESGGHSAELSNTEGTTWTGTVTEIEDEPDTVTVKCEIKYPKSETSDIE